MKKLSFAVLTIALAFVVFPSIGKTADAAATIKSTLIAGGARGIEKVSVGNDHITRTDLSFKQVRSVDKKTLAVNLNYNSFSELNDNYGLAVSKIYSKKRTYKKQAQAEYIKINVLCKGNLVAELDIDDKNNRAMHIYDDQHVSSLGMGMPLSPQVHDQQERLEANIKAAGK
ncbi:MAG: hypothetical protein ACXVDJ_00695 [Tumebacillaceae bacterium]